MILSGRTVVSPAVYLPHTSVLDPKIADPGFDPRDDSFAAGLLKKVGSLRTLPG